MKFRKKPVEIDAVHWTGSNTDEIIAFAEGKISVQIQNPMLPPILYIHTLEGTMAASVGDWIIREANGEYYPCKPDIFEKTYEKV